MSAVVGPRRSLLGFGALAACPITARAARSDFPPVGSDATLKLAHSGEKMLAKPMGAMVYFKA